MARRQQYLQQGNAIYLTDKTWVGAWDEEEEPNVLHEVCPELKKLDKLDAQEKALYKQALKRTITYEQYDAAVAVIKTKRDKLTTKLEKEGYFGDEPLEPEACETASNTTPSLGIGSVLSTQLGPVGRVIVFGGTMIAITVFQMIGG